MRIQQNTNSIGENEEIVGYEKPTFEQRLSYGTPRLTKVLKNKIWFPPLNMCCNVLEMTELKITQI